MRKLLALTATLMLGAVLGCTNWEQTTYKTLAASQAVLNQAQFDYEVSASQPCAAVTVPCLPHTSGVYKTINEAKAAQKTAVDAFVAYEEAKAQGGTSASLTALQADTVTALNALPGIIADVKALYTNGGK